MTLFALRHTKEGQETLATLLAQKYVQRGARWLNRHAPRGWYRNCLNGGSSRIHTSYSNEGVLGIAFEYCEKFADNSGYINEGKVLRYFNLWAYSRRAYRLGFETPLGNFKPFVKRYPEIKITDKIIDSSWAELLKDPPAEWRICYRHPTALDRRFAAMRFDDMRPRFSLWQWTKNLWAAGMVVTLIAYAIR